jgi:hypothetical protein
MQRTSTTTHPIWPPMQVRVCHSFRIATESNPNPNPKRAVQYYIYTILLRFRQLARIRSRVGLRADPWIDRVASKRREFASCGRLLLH